MRMTNDEILKELSEAMRQNREAKRVVGEALSHASNAIWQASKKPSEDSLIAAYERGLNEAWELSKRIYVLSSYGGYTMDELEVIFGDCIMSEIYKKYSAKEALAKEKAYKDSRLKQEEKTEELTRGDVVEVRGLYTGRIVKGIYCHEDNDEYQILTEECPCAQLLRKSNWQIRKLGKHVDIFKDI